MSRKDDHGGWRRRGEDFRYLGRVVITSGSMKVDLYLPDGGRQRPLSWNDDYTLMQKGTVRIR